MHGIMHQGKLGTGMEDRGRRQIQSAGRTDTTERTPELLHTDHREAGLVRTEACRERGCWGSRRCGQSSYKGFVSEECSSSDLVTSEKNLGEIWGQRQNRP